MRYRIRIIFIGIVIAALILAGALYNTAVIHGKDYVKKADLQYARPTAELFDRGSIYFSSKDETRIAAATIERGNLVYANPRLLADAEQAYNALKDYIKIDRDLFLHTVSDTHAAYVEIAHHVDDSSAQSIAGLSMKGIGVIPESWRSYPGESLSAHTLGLVGEDSGTSTIEGKYGLERYYQDVLSRPGVGSSVSVFAQLFAGVRDAIVGGDKQGDIVTTIEPTVQGYLEKVLSDTYDVWHPDEIGGIVLDPKTGEIVAMSSLPTFDANDTSGVKNASVFSDPLVEHVYEMGSIMKPLTIAAGLDAGVITPTFTYEDKGTLTLNGRTIGNYDGKARGRTDIQTILSQSLNVGAATVGLTLGSAGLYKYFSQYGLGGKTGIDLPSEATGLIGNLQAGRDIDVATASYGQGIAVSPVEMAQALSILANGGYRVVPHVVKEIDYRDGSVHKIAPDKSSPILQKQTTDEVTSMLVKVVDTALAKGAIKMDDYSIAAKTGTAQIADHAGGGYYKDRYLHSFFGYFPAYNPRYLVFLYQVYPKGAQYASETLTMPFDTMTKFLINYYNIPPDR